MQVAGFGSSNAPPSLSHQILCVEISCSPHAASYLRRLFYVRMRVGRLVPDEGDKNKSGDHIFSATGKESARHILRVWWLATRKPTEK